MRKPAARLVILTAAILLPATIDSAAAAADQPVPPIAPVPIYARAHPPATPALEDLPLAPSATRHGITWRFDRPGRIGRFVNGDPYVVGPVTVTAIDPKPLWGDEVKDPVDRGYIHEAATYPGKLARNGSTLNLKALTARARRGGAQGAGFDSRIPCGCYDPDEFAHLPIAMKPGDSLVSTVSYANAEVKAFDNVDNADVIRRAAVLTCLAAPRPPDAFRPSYCETATCRIYLSRDLRRDLLPSLKPPAGRRPSLAVLADATLRPWIDVVDWGFAAPQEDFPLCDYGQNLAETGGEVTLSLELDYPVEEKEPLLVNFVQIGIDLFGAARGGRNWEAWGGHFSGRKWPIVFAGILLDDPELRSPARSLPQLRFGEDDQTAMCPYVYDGVAYERAWTGARAFFTGHSLTRAKGGTGGSFADGWGPVELFPPGKWPKLGPDRLPSSEGYRRANTSMSWPGEALAARILHAEPVWDHDAFFAYVDRWMTEDDTEQNEAIRKAGGPDYNARRPRSFGRQGACGEFVDRMWALYRDRLPPAPDGHRDPPAAATWR